MRYIVYDSEGRILRAGSCPADMILDQAQAGENVMEVSGAISDTLHKVAGGKVVNKLPEEIESPPEPDPRELLIQRKQTEILRRMAIDELTKEGLL